MPPRAAGFGANLVWAMTTNQWRASVTRGKHINQAPRLNHEMPHPSDDDLEIIEQLLGLALEAINRKTPDVRLADVLKLLEFKHRLQPQTDVRTVFWEWIERFRQDAARQSGEEE
ncbi:hypothetical protein ACFLQW_03260 [Candidatus Zixiibacteriota bacterium]